MIIDRSPICAGHGARFTRALPGARDVRRRRVGIEAVDRDQRGAHPAVERVVGQRVERRRTAREPHGRKRGGDRAARSASPSRPSTTARRADAPRGSRSSRTRRTSGFAEHPHVADAVGDQGREDLGVAVGLRRGSGPAAHTPCHRARSSRHMVFLSRARDGEQPHLAVTGDQPGARSRRPRAARPPRSAGAGRPRSCARARPPGAARSARGPPSCWAARRRRSRRRTRRPRARPRRSARRRRRRRSGGAHERVAQRRKFGHVALLFVDPAQRGQPAADALADHALRAAQPRRDPGVVLLLEHAGADGIGLLGRQPREQRLDARVTAEPLDPRQQLVVERDRLHPEPPPGAILDLGAADARREHVAGDPDQPGRGRRAAGAVAPRARPAPPRTSRRRDRRPAPDRPHGA